MKKKIILFGAGNYGMATYELLKDDYQIICFCDNNTSLQGKYIFGLPILSPGDILLTKDENTDVVISSSYFLEIGQQLEDMSITEYYIGVDGAIYPKQKRKEPNKIRRCSRCIMDDSSDNTILFDEKGQCNYCTSALKSIGHIYFPNNDGKIKLENMLDKLKKYGENKKYDCIMGLSGGLDSSYLTYLGYKWGLRILVVHVDDGFDTEISKSNIEKLINKTRFDYETIELDREQYVDLVVAYMKAGVPNIAVPQDNCDLAYIYDRMHHYNISYFLSGDNFALECILQKGNIYSNLDVNNILNIHKRYGTKPIDRLKFISSDQKRQLKDNLGLEVLRPLDLIDYNKEKAFAELVDFCGFEYYGRKHLENTLTAFIQLYWFPRKFGVDKRTSHLSSMIVSGQITRAQALDALKEPVFDQREMEECIRTVKKSLKLSDEEFDQIMNADIHRHEDYNA